MKPREMTITELASLGGKARAKKLSRQRTKEIGRNAALARWYEYCGDCDGVGWVEGGKAIKTNCKTCDGTGMVRK